MAQVLMWPKGKTIDDATMIGEEDGGLYKLKGQSFIFSLYRTTDGKKKSIWTSKDLGK